jgi:hypothetical protein
MTKFRCSRVGDLMTESRTKGQLSETAKSFIIDTYLLNEYGYNEPVSTIPMRKGVMMEAEALKLIDSVLKDKQLRITSQKRAEADMVVKYENEYLIGTPDVVLYDTIEDIKISDSIGTFIKSDLKPVYYWQLQAYMKLTGRKKARLIYCLLPDPVEIMEAKIRKLSYQFDTAEEIVCRNNEAILKIPTDKRIKVYEFDFNAADIERLYSRIEQAREYYEELKLTI